MTTTRTEAGHAPVSVIPQELRDRPSWVCWRHETRDGKLTKIPYTPAGAMASSTDQASWSSFEACSTAEGFSGIGYVFSEDDPYTGVDFDDCLDGDRLDPNVAVHLLALDSYTEVSPSGTGVKTIVRAEKKIERCRTSKTPWKSEFECYDRGRYFALTGQHLRGTPTTIEPRQAELDRVLSHVFPAPPEKPTMPTTGAGVLDVDDEALLELARQAKNGGKFGMLWVGDTTGYGSESEADLALVSMLAFWTGPDPERIDSLFRGSGLMREKWNRADYAERTITKALAGMTEFYTGATDGREIEAYLASLNGRTVTTTKAANAPAASKRQLVARPLSETPLRAVTWLVDGLIPFGGLTLCAGVGGKGKTTWLLGIAARLSTSGGVSLIVTYEDDVARTVRPRVEAAGGNVELVKEIVVATGDVDEVSFPTDVDALHDLVREHEAQLVVLDPIVAGIDMRYDTHKNRDVRVVLSQLRTVAEAEQTAIVMVGHLNKGPSTDAYLRVGESVAFYNASRSVVLVTEDETDKDVYRLVTQRKPNLAPEAPPQRWRFEDVHVGEDPQTGTSIKAPVMKFVEIADDVDRDDVLGSRTPRKTDTAESWLAMALADGGWHESSELKAFAEKAGISARTVQRVVDELGVDVKREGFPSKSFWRLAPVAPNLVAPNPPPKLGATVDPAQPGRLHVVEDPVAPDPGGVA